MMKRNRTTGIGSGNGTVINVLSFREWNDLLRGTISVAFNALVTVVLLFSISDSSFTNRFYDSQQRPMISVLSADAFTAVRVSTQARNNQIVVGSNNRKIGQYVSESTVLVPSSLVSIINQMTFSTSTSTTLFGKRRKRHGRKNLYSNNDDNDSDNKHDLNDSDDDKNYRDALALNRARTDIRNFLTQRSIQSFQFLLSNCRDDATIRWLEKTYDIHNLENFHGTGAFNLTLYPTWDSMLTDMLQRPKDVIVVASRRRGGGRAGMFSKNMLASKKRISDTSVQVPTPSPTAMTVGASNSTSTTASSTMSVGTQSSTLPQSPPRKNWAPWGTNKYKVVQVSSISTSANNTSNVQTEQPISRVGDGNNVLLAKSTSTSTSANNGYINSMDEYKQLEERWIETTIDIDPPSLVSRIVSVREQIAREWTKDIETLISINDMILNAYRDQQTSERSTGVSYCLDSVGTGVDDTVTKQPNDSRNKSSQDTDESTSASSGSVPKSSGPKKVAFDRSQMQFYTTLINYDGSASSSYRHSSLDLLALLATQESIHRLLREYREDGAVREVSFQWLRDYYRTRVSKYFDGNQHYGRADDFLEELLLTAPVMKEVDDGKHVGLIDPLRIAEDIIAIRTDVYYDWIDTMANVLDYDHMDLRRIILSIQMGQALEETLFKSELYMNKQETANALLQDYDFFQ